MTTDRYLTAGQIADHIEKVDEAAFAWLLDLQDTHDFEAQDAKELIVSVLREHSRRGLPTKEQIEFAIDNTEFPTLEELQNDREMKIADDMRYTILQRVREMTVR